MTLAGASASAIRACTRCSRRASSSPLTSTHNDVNGDEEARREQRVQALMAEALAPASVITHSTGYGARTPMVWLTARPSRSTSPPTAAASSAPVAATWDSCPGPGAARRQTDDSGRKSRHRGVGVASAAMTTGRATQRLARTKCLQWLNSFDEDD